MRINWITIKDVDLKKSKEFYGEYIGLRLDREFSPQEGMNLAFFKDENGMEIELIENVGKVKKYEDGISIGIQTSRYEEILEEARRREIVVVEPRVLGGGMECFFISDPNGVLVQIIKQ